MALDGGHVDVSRSVHGESGRVFEGVALAVTGGIDDLSDRAVGCLLYTSDAADE